MDKITLEYIRIAVENDQELGEEVVSLIFSYLSPEKHKQYISEARDEFQKKLLNLN